jgi:hypothetical protein
LIAAHDFYGPSKLLATPLSAFISFEQAFGHETGSSFSLRLDTEQVYGSLFAVAGYHAFRDGPQGDGVHMGQSSQAISELGGVGDGSLRLRGVQVSQRQYLEMAQSRPDGLVDHLSVSAILKAAHPDDEHEPKGNGCAGQYGTPEISGQVSPR